MESFSVNYFNKCVCAPYYAAQYNLSMYFKFHGIRIKCRKYLGAKFSLNDPREMKLIIKAFLTLLIMCGGMLIHTYVTNSHVSNTLLCQSYIIVLISLQ